VAGGGRRFKVKVKNGGGFRELPYRLNRSTFTAGSKGSWFRAFASGESHKTEEQANPMGS